MNTQKDIHTFTEEELMEMTEGFMHTYGDGRYATVFKGELHYEEVAIKRYNSDDAALAKVRIIINSR